MTDQPVDLEHVDRFASLSDEELATITKAGTPVTVPADWALMGEGTSADKAYLLVDGEVEVRRHGTPIATLGPGDIVGEVGIVGHRLRTATVVSRTRLECLHFTRAQLEELRATVPAFRAALEAAVAERSVPPA
jgi:CRP-like cAMP-binding protein